MSPVFDKFITALFVIILGSVWFLTKRYETPHLYKIVAYDIFGNQVSPDGIRTTFNTHLAAISFAKHYGEIFPHYAFALKSELPNVKRGFLPKKTQI